MRLIGAPGSPAESGGSGRSRARAFLAGPPWADVPVGAATRESGHGRRETRTIKAVTVSHLDFPTRSRRAACTAGVGRRPAALPRYRLCDHQPHLRAGRGRAARPQPLAHRRNRLVVDHRSSALPVASTARSKTSRRPIMYEWAESPLGLEPHGWLADLQSFTRSQTARRVAGRWARPAPLCIDGSRAQGDGRNVEPHLRTARRAHDDLSHVSGTFHLRSARGNASG